jgi:phage tail-like protein
MLPGGLTSLTPAGANGSAGQNQFRKYGMAMRFEVWVDGLGLGQWTSCEGLKVEFTTEPVKNGGHYDHEAALPVDVKYSPITLKRAMIKGDSDKVLSWLREVAGQWVNYDGTGDTYQGGNAQITLLDVYGGTVAAWTLRGARPSSWSAPALNSKQSEVALETLVIVHQGFL